MNDDTRKLLKIFGVAVTDSEAEVEGWSPGLSSFRLTAPGRRLRHPEGWRRSLPRIEYPMAGDHRAGFCDPVPLAGSSGGSSRKGAGFPMSIQPVFEIARHRDTLVTIGASHQTRGLPAYEDRNPG